MALFRCCLKEAAYLFEMLITKGLLSHIFQFSNPGFDFHRTRLICLAPSLKLLEARVLCFETKKKKRKNKKKDIHLYISVAQLVPEILLGRLQSSYRETEDFFKIWI